MPTPARSRWLTARGEKIYALARGGRKYHPAHHRAAKAIGLVIPALSGKLKGHAQRVPTKTGSVTELVSIPEKKVTADEVNQAMKKRRRTTNPSATPKKRSSSDIIGSHFGSIYDATLV